MTSNSTNMFDYESEIKYMTNKYWAIPIKKPESELEKEVNDSESNTNRTIEDIDNYFDGYYSSTPHIVNDKPDIGAISGHILNGVYSTASNNADVFKYLGNFDKNITATHEVVHKINQMTGMPQDEYLVENQTERMKGLIRIVYNTHY